MQQFKISSALGLSFRALFRNFVPFLLLTVVLYAPVVIWVMTVDLEHVSSLDALLDRAIMWPIYAVIGLSALVAPLLTYRVIQDLNGVRVSMMTSIKLGLRGFLPALFVAVMVNVLQLLPAGGIFATVITCIYFVAAPAAVAEQLGPFAALGRSATLTTGRRWGIFGLTFLMGIALVVLLLAWIVPAFENLSGDFEGNVRRMSIYMVCALGALQMFTGIVAAVSYALLRQDKDGVSHEELARVFE